MFSDTNNNLTMSTLFKNLRINIGKLLGKIPDLKSQIKFLQDTNILPTSQTCTNCNKLLNKSSAEGSFVFFRCGLTALYSSGVLLHPAELDVQADGERGVHHY